MAEYPGNSWDDDSGGDLFDVLTQRLFVPEGDLAEVDQHLTQAPTEFNFDLHFDAPLVHQSEEGAGKLQGESLQGAEEVQRFGPCVTSSQIATLLFRQIRRTQAGPLMFGTTGLPIESDKTRRIALPACLPCS